jgi:large subunit ribosomal protein L1
MSKTSQENKVKKTKLAKEETEVTEKVTKKSRKASDLSAEVSTKAEKATPEVLPEVKEAVTEDESASVEKEEKVKTSRVRGKKYQAAKKLIEVTKYYPLKDAVALVKKTSISKFDGKVECHITTFDIGPVGEITFPHLETAAKKIVILNDAILAEIKDGKLNFDILIATPATMPRLLPFARTLGPKGLMPNPKNGTLTDKPEEAVKKLSVAKQMIATEKKAAIIHVVVGKVSQTAAELEANIAELIKVVKPTKIKKLAVCATMGPSVKIEVIK